LPDQALEPRLGILDRLAVLLQHEMLGRMLEALLAKPSRVRLRPRGAAGEDPTVAEQEGLEVLALGAQVLHRRLVGAHELAHRFVTQVGHPDPVSPPARCRRAKVIASRRLVLTRSPDVSSPTKTSLSCCMARSLSVRLSAGPPSVAPPLAYRGTSRLHTR
jgi:hypothetical protein